MTLTDKLWWAYCIVQVAIMIVRWIDASSLNIRFALYCLSCGMIGAIISSSIIQHGHTIIDSVIGLLCITACVFAMREIIKHKQMLKAGNKND